VRFLEEWRRIMASVQMGGLVVFACGCAVIVLALVVAPLPRVRRVVGGTGLIVMAFGLADSWHRC
jgi:hypothetical protein